MWLRTEGSIFTMIRAKGALASTLPEPCHWVTIWTSQLNAQKLCPHHFIYSCNVAYRLICLGGSCNITETQLSVRVHKILGLESNDIHLTLAPTFLSINFASYCSFLCLHFLICKTDMMLKLLHRVLGEYLK